MVEIQRVAMPVGYFPTVPESSSILGALRSETDLEELGPDYIRVDPVIRVVGQRCTSYLSINQVKMLHICFLEGDPAYALAHQKVQGTLDFIV